MTHQWIFARNMEERSEQKIIQLSCLFLLTCVLQSVCVYSLYYGLRVWSQTNKLKICVVKGIPLDIGLNL